MSIDLVFYTQLGSVLVFITALFVLYRLLVEKKEATIQFLEKQLQAAKEEKPDIVLKQLQQRVQIAREEMERLARDKETLVGLNDKAITYIDSLEGVIRSNKDLIEVLEEYRQEALQWRPLKKFFVDIVEHLDAEGRTIAVHKDEDGTVRAVTITPD